MAWHRREKQIECIDCGEKPKEWGKLTLRTRSGKVSIPSPKDFHFSYKAHVGQLNILEDVAFRCAKCFKSYRNLKNKQDHGHLRALNKAHEEGGDIFSLKPLYGGAWGNGKR